MAQTAVTSLPFTEGFETGELAPYWTANPTLSGQNGVAAVFAGSEISVMEPFGGYALALGNSTDNNPLTQNTADLRVNLTAYEGQQLELSFWYRTYSELTEAADAIYLSDDNGATFFRAIALEPERWQSSTWLLFPKFDLDELMEQFSLTYSANFIIRFSHVGQHDFSSLGPEDGMFFDEINIRVADEIVKATPPVEINFESPQQEQHFSYRYAELDISGSPTNKTTPSSRAGFLDDVNFAYEGGYSLFLGKFNDSNGDNISYANFHLDLSGVSLTDELLLQFRYRHFQDETQFSDGIWLSDDGGENFIRVIGLEPSRWQSNSYGEFPVFELHRIIQNEPSLDYTNDFIIQFRQEGIGDLSTLGTEDGLLFDNIILDIKPRPTYVSLPFFEDFESAALENHWRVTRTDLDNLGNPISGVTPNFLSGLNDNTGENESTSLILGKRNDANGENVSYGDLHLNLSEGENIQLNFAIRPFFEDFQFNDGIFFSNDGGVNFVKIYSFDFDDLTNNIYTTINLDISDLLATNSIIPSATSVIRFQQNGEGDFSTLGTEDGIFIDNISITGDVNSNCIDLVLTPVAQNASCSENDGQIILTATGGTEPYTYDLSGMTNSSGIFPGLPADNYTVGVLDANSCNIFQSVTVGEEGTPPLPSFTVSNNGLTISLIPQITGSINSYLWSFGDATSSQQIAPNHTYANAGTYNVCLTTTGGCGSAGPVCQTVTVSETGNGGLILELGEVEGAVGDTVLLPLYIRGATNISSLQGSFELEIAGIGQELLGFQPGIIEPSPSGTLPLRFSWLDFVNVQGTPVNDNDILFYFRIEITGGNPGDFTPARITNDPLVVEVTAIENGNVVFLDPILQTGLVQVLDNVNITGRVSFWEDLTPMEDVTVTMSIEVPLSSTTTFTDVAGNYLYSDVPVGTDIALFADKPAAAFTNGLSTGALFLVQRYILGLNPSQIFSPYQLIAADVNCSDGVSTIDILLTQRVLLGINDDFPDCPSWVFIPEDNNLTLANPFPYPIIADYLNLTTDVAINFIGVKKGDILGSADPQNLQGPTEDYAARNTPLGLSYTIPEQWQIGELLDIPIHATSSFELGSLQMALSFSTEVFQFLEVVPATLNTPLANYLEDEASLRVSWFDYNGQGINVAPNEPLFILRLNAKQAGHQETFGGELLRLVNNQLRGEAWSTNLEDRCPVELFPPAHLTATKEQIPATKIVVSPNPSSDLFTISIPAMQEHTNAHVEITDAQGKLIYSQASANFNNNHLKIDGSDWPEGMYWVTVCSGKEIYRATLIIQ